MRTENGQWLLVSLTAGMLLAAGCAAPKPLERPADVAAQFAPPAKPADFDAQRAGLPLARIPDDPSAPAGAEAGPPTELPRQAERRLESARRLFAEQRFSEAIQELTSALRYQVDIHEAHRLLALASQLAGDKDKARSHAERALAVVPDDLACHYVLGRLADEAGRGEEARRRYRLALKCPDRAGDAPYRALVQYHLGLQLAGAGYHAAAVDLLCAFEAAIEQLGEAVKSTPELSTIARARRVDLLAALAESQALLDRYAAAAATLQRAVALRPDDAELRRRQVRMLVLAGDEKSAVAATRAYVSQSKASRESLSLLLAVHRYQGRPEQVIDVVRSLIAEQPDDATLRLFLVDALLAAQRPDDAAAALAELLERQPDLPEAQWRLVALQQTRGDWPGWLKALARELTTRPVESARLDAALQAVPDAVARRFVVELTGNPGPGDRVWPGLTPQDPTYAAGLYLIGRLAARVGDDPAARRLYVDAAAADPNFDLTAGAAVEQLLADYRWPEAIEAIETARATRPEPSALLEALMGRALDGLDRNEQAAARYEAAAGLNPRDIRPLRWHAELLERTDRPREAIKKYSDLLEVEPDNLHARERIIRLLWAMREEPIRIARELAELERIAPEAAVTRRCQAMVQTLRPPRPDWEAFAEAMIGLLDRDPADTASREDLIRAYLGARRFEEALQETDQLLAKAPTSIAGHELRAHALTRLLRFDEAQAEYERLLQRYPHRSPYLQAVIRLLAADGQYDRVISLLETILAGEVSDAQRLSYRDQLMTALREVKRHDQARALAEQWLAELNPDDADLRRYRWLALAVEAAAGNADAYLKQVFGWLEDAPESPELRGWLIGGQIPTGSEHLSPPEGRSGLIGAELFDEAAIRILGWMHEEGVEENAQPWLADWLIVVLQAAGRSDEAIELARDEVASAGSPEIKLARLSGLRELYLRVGRLDDAVAVGKEVLSEIRTLMENAEDRQQALIEGLLSEQRQMQARVLARAGQFDEAIADLRQMIGQIDGLRRRGDELIARLEDPRAKAQVLASVQQAQRQQAVLLRTLSYVYQQQGKADAALDALREAYRLFPEDVGMNNDYGYSLADAGHELPEAERMIRLALSESPNEAAYLDSLGWVRYKSGDLDGAYRWLRRASLAAQGDDPVIWDHLGDVHWRLGQHDEAVTAWKQSLAFQAEREVKGLADPKDPHVAATRAKLAAVEAGQDPAVAEIPAATQPAAR